MSCDCSGSKGGKRGKDGKDGKDRKDRKDGKDGKDGKDRKDRKDGKDDKVGKGIKDSKDCKVCKEKSVKEDKDAKDTKSIDGKGVEDDIVVKEINEGKDDTDVKDKNYVGITPSNKTLTDSQKHVRIDSKSYEKDISLKNEKLTETKIVEDFGDKDWFIGDLIDSGPIHRTSPVYDFKRSPVDEFLWSCNSITKIIACFTYLVSALIFYIQPEEIDETETGVAWIIMLPILDIICGFSIAFVYVGIIYFLHRNKIQSLIILDITIALVLALMLLVSTMTMFDEKYSMAIGVQRLAAAIALVAVILQVCSGFATVIKYHPNNIKKTKKSTNSGSIVSHLLDMRTFSAKFD